MIQNVHLALLGLRRAAVWLVLFLGVAFLPQAAVATPGTNPLLAETCHDAARQAARQWNVPVDVLHAITLTESGRPIGGRLRPWPWTVNMEGKGVWFETRQDALDYIGQARARGARSFDVGCFQINHRWHGKAFPSIHTMFDPLANATYAARFLSELYEEFGDWSVAAGAYHSRTPDLARKYRARFDRIRVNLPDGQDGARVAHVPDTPLPRDSVLDKRSEPHGPDAPNGFPLLLRAGAPISAGSLVPLDADGPIRRLVPAG